MPDKQNRVPTAREFASAGFSRRELLTLSAQVALAVSAGGVLSSSIVGCGGDAALQPYTLNGTVALSEVGGQGLVLRSVLGTANVGATGNVSIDTPLESAKLAVVRDAGDHARAMGVLKPGGGASDTFRIDADSTALSLVFLSPGIATSDPAQWQERASRIHALESYSTLAALLRARMPTTTLEEILALPEVLGALQTVISEYVDLPAPAGRDIVPQPGRAFCEVKVADQSNPRAVSLRLENSAWRYASVFRRDVDSSGVEVALKDMGQIGGGRAFSFGSILASSHGEPTQLADANIDFGNFSKCEYWLFGPGFASPTAPQQSQVVDIHLEAAIGKSIIVYMLFPVIDLVTGVAGDLSRLMSLADELWSSISAAVDLTDLVTSMLAKQWEEALVALTDAVGSVAALLLDSGILVAKGLLSASANSFLAFVLIVAGVGMAAGNMIVALYNWWLIPSASQVEVLATGDGGVIIR